MQTQTFQLTHILSYMDLLLTPVYLLLILLFLFYWRKKFYTGSPVKQYFIIGFLLKAAGCIFLALLYEYKYNGISDAHNYYTGANEIWNAAKANPSYALELIFKPIENCSAKALEFTEHMTYEYFSYETRNMFKISGFIGLFCFGTYLPIALIFTLLGFFGTWKIFMVFYRQFPKMHKWLAAACIFTPSTLIWSTNVMKDPLCMFGLGLCVSALFDMYRQKWKLITWIQLLGGAFILLFLKGYIFYGFCLAGLVSVYRMIVLAVRNKMIRNIFRYSVTILMIAGILWTINNIDVIGEKLYENFLKPTEIIQESQQIASEGGSGYTIPNINDFSATGIFKTYLMSLNVALFRPYPWECKNLLMYVNSLETTLILLLTIYLLFRSKLFGFFRFARKQPLLVYAIVFTLIMAPMAGFISFNFGTLSRYKLPLIPFYYSYLVLLLNQLRTKQPSRYAS